MTIEIRHIKAQDLNSIVHILNHYIKNTAITFDTELYCTETRRPWLDQFQTSGRYQCLVAISEGKIIGYANSAAFRPKNAYDTSVEISIYLKDGLAGNGIGTRLYSRLFDKLASEDIHRAYALITLPNETSINLHSKFGFIEAGTLSEAGRKFGKFYSVYLMEKKL